MTAETAQLEKNVTMQGVREDNYMDDFKSEDYEPTDKEWSEIEELILQEERDELNKEKKEFATAMISFKRWCKENGILW